MSPGIYGDVDLSALDTDQMAAGDTAGASPEAPAGVQGVDETQPIPGGPLLEEPDAQKVFRAIDKRVRAQERLAKNRAAASKHWGRVRRGVPFSQLEKSEDKAEWKATLPPGVADTEQPIPNKADDLCSKIVSQVVVDPFKPDPKPKTDSDTARAASDLAKRFLTADGDESGTNDAEVIRASLDTAMTHASGFVHLWVDETGGGWTPLQIKAHPQAVDANNPLLGPDGMPTTDYILRYVTDAGQFTENPSEAARQWRPKIRRDLLTTAHVRTYPDTEPVATSDAVILLMVAPLSDARRRFAVLRDMAEDDLQKLCDWRPPRAKALVPEALMGRFRAQDKADTRETTDDTLLFWYQKYCRVGPDYPDGAEIAVTGGLEGTVLKRATLRDDVQEGDTDGGTVPILRDIPVSQCVALIDAEGRDPFGRRPIEKFGAANEARAQLYGGVLEDMDRRLHPNLFLPLTSPIQGWQLTQRTGDPLPVLSKDDMPQYEEFADLPSFVPTVIDTLDRDMDQAAGLSETAQGLDAGTAVSGVAKEAVLKQAKVNLAPIYQNVITFVKRYWRLKLELAQAKLTVPQQVEFSGADAAHKQRYWTGADLAGVGDVSIQPGSGTMMSPTEKQAFLQVAQMNQWVPPDEAQEIGRSTIADDLGMQRDRHEELIDRQIATWMEGPPGGWMPQQVDPMGMPVLDPMGQPMPAPWSPFAPRPTDEDPAVAPVRYRKLRLFIAGADYLKHEPEWRALVDAEYLRMRTAAGVQTIPEQQAAMAQQQEQQAMQQQEQQAAQASEKDADRQFQNEQKDKDRAEARSERAEQQAHEMAMQPPAAAGGFA